jgi:hypothetical protein
MAPEANLIKLFWSKFTQKNVLLGANVTENLDVNLLKKTL